MRLSEILFENDREDLIRDQVITLITTAHANNIPSITVAQIRKSLDSSGLNVPTKWLLDTIKSIAVVKNIDKDNIILDLDQQDAASKPGTMEQNDSQTVKSMARKALKRRTK
jgi:hypothetical protein